MKHLGKTPDYCSWGVFSIIIFESEDRCCGVQVGSSIGRLQEEAKAIKNDLSAAHSQQKSRQTSKILSDFEVCYSMCKEDIPG